MATQTNEISQWLESGSAPPPPPNKIRRKWRPERVEMHRLGHNLPQLPDPSLRAGVSTSVCGSVVYLSTHSRVTPTQKEEDAEANRFPSSLLRQVLENRTGLVLLQEPTSGSSSGE